MSRAKFSRNVRPFVVAGLLAGALSLFAQPAAVAQTCEESCGYDYNSCSGYCDQQYYDCWNNTPGYYCDSDRNYCQSSCDNTYNSCTTNCTPPPPPDGDGHALCDWPDRQGDCAYSHLGVSATAGGADFRRLRGSNGYDWQTFLTWNSAEFNGFGRFPVADGTVGVISTTQLSGQIPLHRWSTPKGFYYSTNFVNHGSGYTYGGVAGYVWPAGTNTGYPLYQFYSTQYGHFYTNYPSEIRCQPPVGWSFQGEMARVDWPAPAAQANRNCSSTIIGGIPPSCNPFVASRCQQLGLVFRFNDCSCF
jgi:hypothetical protein